ncbi:MAG: hypothetical protein WC543_00135 [Candidatus Omnitrophota bacterium]
MFKEINNFELSGVLTKELQTEVEEMFRFLLVFASSYSEIDKHWDFPDKYKKVLGVWTIIMQKQFGWSYKKLQYMTSKICLDINKIYHKRVPNKIKDKLEDYEKFSQKNNYYRKGKRPVVDVSNDGGNISRGIIPNPPDVVIMKKKKPTDKQVEYILLRAKLKEEGVKPEFIIKKCAEILGKTVQEIKQMEAILIKNAQTSHTVNEIGYEELTEKSQQRDYAEIDDEKIIEEGGAEND